MPRKPVKGISSVVDLDRFRSSDTYAQLLLFIRSLSEAVTGSPNQYIPYPTVSVTESTSNNGVGAVSLITQFFSRLYDLVDEIPPIRQPMRFGNKAFRQWKLRLSEIIPGFLSSLLTAETKEYAVELSHYLSESFGNETRIDYGTGHELNLVVFFYCLYKLQVMTQDDLKDIGLTCFVGYIRIMRRLQIDYVLEPAGSHGVWGLDDYHCLLYVLGAAQLRKHAEITPSSVNDETILGKYAGDYLYIEGIQFIRRVKHTAPFAETSPMLSDISHLPDWQRVYAGLLRLFEGEVLGKLPVAQHLFFGDLFACSWVLEPASLSDREFNAEIATKAPWSK
jgi:hypothetical protein